MQKTRQELFPVLLSEQKGIVYVFDILVRRLALYMYFTVLSSISQQYAKILLLMNINTFLDDN